MHQPRPDISRKGQALERQFALDLSNNDVKSSCYIKYDWLDIFTEPIQIRVTSRIRI